MNAGDFYECNNPEAAGQPQQMTFAMAGHC